MPHHVRYHDDYTYDGQYDNHYRSTNRRRKSTTTASLALSGLSDYAVQPSAYVEWASSYPRRGISDRSDDLVQLTSGLRRLNMYGERSGSKYRVQSCLIGTLAPIHYNGTRMLTQVIRSAKLHHQLLPEKYSNSC